MFICLILIKQAVAKIHVATIFNAIKSQKRLILLFYLNNQENKFILEVKIIFSKLSK